MRRLLMMLCGLGLMLSLGCGSKKEEYTGPQPVPVTGKNAVGNYGPPGEGPGPGPPKGPPKLPGGR